MRVMLLTEHHLEFLSLKGGCTGSSGSTLVKMTHCWKSQQRQFTETLLSLLIRCSVPGVVLIVSIPSLLFILTRVPTHKNTVYCAILSDQIVDGCPLGVPISY